MTMEYIRHPIDIGKREDTALEGSSEHKPLNAIAMDKIGNRMVVGGVEGVLKLWDFSLGEGIGAVPCFELQPLENHAINAVSFNCNDSVILCVSSDAKARIFNTTLSPQPVEETIKGDQYIRTPENTKGHTNMLSCGSFHPSEAARFMTGSYDSTVRLWDIHTKKVGMDQNIPNLNCFKCIDQRGICGGMGMYVASANYSSDGKQVIAGCSDGSIQLFHEKYKYGKPLSVARISTMGEVTDVQFTSNDSEIISRSFDGHVRIFDLRFLKKSEPVSIFRDALPTDRSFCNLAIDHVGNSIIGGTCPGGELVVIPLDENKDRTRRKFAAPSLIQTYLHPATNELFACSSDGNVFAVYEKSRHKQVGIEQAISVTPGVVYKKPAPVDTSRQIDRNVYAYEDLIESGKYRENRSGEIRAVRQQVPVGRQIIESEPVKVLDELEKRFSSGRSEVPVSSMQKYLLSFDEKLKGDEPSWVGNAYKRTQPDPVLDYSDVQGSADSLLKKAKQFCPRCGLKMCTCGFMTRPGSSD